MDIILYVAIIFFFLGIFGFLDEISVREIKINVDDVNVGDKIIVKGEEFFVENYSLFVGINVYLPRIIVRIFVDFD
jgi:hypothetical protein